jgi:hypothetical protein
MRHAQYANGNNTRNYENKTMSVLARSFPGALPVNSGTNPAPLPAGLVIPPGIYTYGSVAWDCRSERTYCIWQPTIDRTYRIIWASDIPALMASMAWITAIGSGDNTVSTATITNNARWFKPRLLCGQTVTWARAICTSLGLQTRVVRGLTAELPNGYFDGHIMIEVKISGVWRLFDLAGGHDFTAGDGSARDTLPLVTGQRRVITKKSVAVEQIASSLFDPLVWQEMTLSNPNDIEAEWMRVLKIPGIDRTNGETVFWLPPGTESRSAWVQSLSPLFKIATREAWLAEFYPL